MVWVLSLQAEGHGLGDYFNSYANRTCSIEQRIWNGDAQMPVVGQQGQMDGQFDQKGKGTGKVSDRGRVAMTSPTTSAIWAGVEPQRLGPVQQRGQAAMGVTTMTDGRFEHVPIRNYGPRPRDPEPQERPPIPGTTGGLDTIR